MKDQHPEDRPQSLPRPDPPCEDPETAKQPHQSPTVLAPPGLGRGLWTVGQWLPQAQRWCAVLAGAALHL